MIEREYNSKDVPIVYTDDKGRLTQEYPKKYFTKKRAIGIIEIKNMAYHSNYKDGVVWVDAHIKDSWIWYQDPEFNSKEII